MLNLAEVYELDPTQLLITSGYLPSDVQDILIHNPREAPGILRETFGNKEHIELNSIDEDASVVAERSPAYQSREELYKLVKEDCFKWMENREPNSIHAIVTDPPYGLKEYSSGEKAKLRRGRGGVWRIPPSLNGCIRKPLPRFTILSEAEKQRLAGFFQQWSVLAFRVLVPGSHIFIATNPLLSHLVYTALMGSGFEKRGEIIRLVQTLRGGDRPKNAHEEFKDVTVMPRSCWEPWGLFRKPCEGRVQDNLRKWGTGGLRRISDDQPFCDVIKSSPTRSPERDISPHPSLKPQAFMRQIVRAALPLEKGIILDPFMGGGSTIAAAQAVGYTSIGIENDPEFFDMAVSAIPRLVAFTPNGEQNGRLFGSPRKTAAGQSSLFG